MQKVLGKPGQQNGSVTSLLLLEDGYFHGVSLHPCGNSTAEEGQWNITSSVFHWRTPSNLIQLPPYQTHLQAASSAHRQAASS